eukprot:9900213-Ditylum_brightwellii.AAC.1
MSSKECQQYMVETGMMRRCIMPQHGLNRGCRYEGKLIGDCPEMNAMDANLNKDIHGSVRMHVSMTRCRPDTDKRKFSMMTQRKGAEVYLCLWDPAHQLVNIEHGAPNSSQIIQDMERIRNETCMQIYNTRGVALEGCIRRRKRKVVGPRRGENEREAKMMKKGGFILMQKK